MKIYTPVNDFNGIRAGVRFVNGVGESNDEYIIRWFEMHGYRVEKSAQTTEEILDAQLETCADPDFDSMTPNELRDWAKANGFGGQIKNIRNKDKLLEIIRG